MTALRGPSLAALALVLALATGCPPASDTTSETAAAPETAGAGATESGPLASEDAKILYAMGTQLARNVQRLSLTEADLAALMLGFEDGALGRDLQVDANEYGPKMQAFMRTRLEQLAQTERDAGQAFIDAAVAAEGAKRTDSGLVYLELAPGKGATPRPTDKVKVHYHGTLRDGTVFDSSVDRGEPAEFPLNRVIPCWTEALQMMQVGAKARIVCPAEIAYGDRGTPGRIPPGATLAFEVELLGIVAASAQAPPQPVPGEAAPAAKAPAETQE